MSCVADADLQSAACIILSDCPFCPLSACFSPSGLEEGSEEGGMAVGFACCLPFRNWSHRNITHHPASQHIFDWDWRLSYTDLGG